MKNKITKKEDPEIFQAIMELDPCDVISEHRRGSTFYTQYVFEILEEDVEYCPDLKDYVGTFWITDTFVSAEDDSDFYLIDEIDRVEKHKKIIEKVEWLPAL